MMLSCWADLVYYEWPDKWLINAVVREPQSLSPPTQVSVSPQLKCLSLCLHKNTLVNQHTHDSNQKQCQQSQSVFHAGSAAASWVSRRAHQCQLCLWVLLNSCPLSYQECLRFSSFSTFYMHFENSCVVQNGTQIIHIHPEFPQSAQVRVDDNQPSSSS